MQEKAVAIREDRQVALAEIETRFAMATRQRELLDNYIKERLKPDKHYYTVSEGQKPSLTKEGAELICLPHGYKPHYHLLSGPESPPPDNSPYQMTIRCELERAGNFEGEGIGSASSYVTKKDGEYKPRQKDPGLCHNATLKMAQKSAYISATLNATAASEFFTQDLEDDQAGETSKPKPGTKEHWCSKHGIAWARHEKDGKVWYSHKTKVTEEYPKGYCNEHINQQPQEEPPPEEKPPIEETPNKLITESRFLVLCSRLGYNSQQQVWKVMEVKDLEDLKSRMTLEEALDNLGKLQGVKDWRSL